MLRAGAEKLSERQIIRLNAGLEAGDPNYEVTIAWQCYQKLRAAFSAKDLHRGRRIAIEVLDSFHTCPSRDRTARTNTAFLAGTTARHFGTGRANN